MAPLEAENSGPRRRPVHSCAGRACSRFATGAGGVRVPPGRCHGDAGQISALTVVLFDLDGFKLIVAADRALYRAKQDGRDRVCGASTTMAAVSQESA